MIRNPKEPRKPLLTLILPAAYCPHCLSVSLRVNGTERHDAAIERYFVCRLCGSSFRALFSFPDKQLLQRAER